MPILTYTCEQRTGKGGRQASFRSGNEQGDVFGDDRRRCPPVRSVDF